MSLTPSKILAESVPTHALIITEQNANEINLYVVLSPDFFISDSGILCLITNFAVLICNLIGPVYAL